jgi:hypothetical protein
MERCNVIHTEIQFPCAFFASFHSESYTILANYIYYTGVSVRSIDITYRLIADEAEI